MTPPKKIFLDLNGASSMSESDCALVFLGKHPLSPHTYISVEWLERWIKENSHNGAFLGEKTVFSDELLKAIKED